MKNYQGLEIKYLGATNNRGSRIKIIDLRFKNCSITLSKNYSLNYNEQINNYLTKIGFNIIGQIELKNNDLIIVDNFIPLLEMITNYNLRIKGA